jgi:hypothetical protein
VCLQPSVGTEVPIVPARPIVTVADHEESIELCSSARFGERLNGSPVYNGKVD